MKRKEMAQKMVHTYLTCRELNYSEVKSMERALEVAEENGMLPPDKGMGCSDPECCGPDRNWDYDTEE